MDERGEAWATPLPRTGRDRARALAAPLLLAAVASLGVYRSATLDQSSWQGASFGMFATYDGPSRTVEVRATDADGTVRVVLPPDLRDDAERLQVVPSDAGARRLAEAVRSRLPADADARVEVVVQRSVLDDGDDLTLHLVRLATGEAG